MAVGRTLELVWISVLLPLAGLINGLLLYYGYRANRTGLKDTLMVAVHTQEGMMPLKTLWIKPVAALVTLASGGSAGKEGPCSHIGASLASAIARGLRSEERRVGKECRARGVRDGCRVSGRGRR